MRERLTGCIKDSGRTGTATAVMLAAVVAALFMVLGATHAGAHDGGLDVDCVVCHISSNSSVKLAPSNAAPPTPQPRVDAYVPPTSHGALEETNSLPTRSRGPPLQNRSA